MVSHAALASEASDADDLRAKARTSEGQAEAVAAADGPRSRRLASARILDRVERVAVPGAASTSSADSKLEVPAKTERHGERGARLVGEQVDVHWIVLRSARCRSGRSRAPPTRSERGVQTRSSCATDIHPMRAAASSIASGTPSAGGRSRRPPPGSRSQSESRPDGGRALLEESGGGCCLPAVGRIGRPCERPNL